MRKAESQFQTVFNQWLRDVYKRTGAWELKHTRGKSSFPFSEVKDHQIRALQVAHHNVLAYKIPDDSMSYKPFDCISLAQEPARIVIRYPKFFCLIDVETFILEKSRSKKKSLSADRAKDISILIVDM